MLWEIGDVPDLPQHSVDPTVVGFLSRKIGCGNGRIYTMLWEVRDDPDLPGGYVVTNIPLWEVQAIFGTCWLAWIKRPRLIAILGVSTSEPVQPQACPVKSQNCLINFPRSKSDHVCAFVLVCVYVHVLRTRKRIC